MRFLSQNESSAEAPLNPELTLNTVQQVPEQNARLILDYLIRKGLVRSQTETNGHGESPASN